ncbi:MAG: sel1 repeat family protein [Alphaproteobacteria bacterium]|nr:sel1 repeat family protein [Alphaproteobacteria bacterium]
MKYKLLLASSIVALLHNNVCYAASYSELYKKALEGDVNSATMIGEMLSKEAKYEDAVKWLEHSAQAGDSRAVYQLALIAEKVNDANYSEENLSHFLDLLKKSAQMGNLDANLKLGKVYQFGRKGVQKDLNQAKIWYEKAANLGSNEAFLQLDLIYQHKGVDSFNKLKEQENVEWLRKTIKTGNVDSIENLTSILEKKENKTQEDLKEIAELYKKSAEAGNIYSAEKLGNIYLLGKGVDKDENKALQWLKVAGLSGNANAARKIGEIYAKKGDNNDEAFAWLVVGLSALFPDVQDLTKVSPDLEDLLNKMTSEEVENAQKNAEELAFKIKSSQKK